MIHHKQEVLTQEEEATIVRVESRLAAGVSKSRLILETGVRKDFLDAMLKRHPVWRHAVTDIDEQDSIEGFAALNQWLEHSQDSHESHAARAETPSFKAMTSILSIAHQSRNLVAITGPVGFGKSFAASCFAAAHPRSHKKPGAMRIQFNATDNKPTAVLAAILTALRGQSIGAYRNNSLYQAVGELLRPDDFLIYDECQRLGPALDIVAGLHDDFRIGGAMLGNPDFSRAVWGRDRTFDALGSRILRHDFANTTGEDVEAWLAWRGSLEGLSVKDRACLVKTAVAIGTRPGREGGLRTLSQVFDYGVMAYGKQAMTGPILSLLVKQLKEGA
jgi:hypothetical protein